MNELGVVYGMTVAAGLTVESIKAISPFLATALPGQPPAHDAWMQLKGNQRIETLLQHVQQLELENKNLKQTISKFEKLSPGSGYTNTLQEYITTPLEEKVELLRNALLNGLYGDFSVELREHFFKIVHQLQPLDIRLLAYLIQKCPSMKRYVEIYQEEKENDSLKKANKTLYYALTLTYEPALEPENEGTINTTFPEASFQALAVSIDRLRNLGLISRPYIMRFGMQTPYSECIPTDVAQSFLKFVTHPYNDVCLDHLYRS